MSTEKKVQFQVGEWEFFTGTQGKCVRNIFSNDVYYLINFETGEKNFEFPQYGLWDVQISLKFPHKIINIHDVSLVNKAIIHQFLTLE